MHKADYFLILMDNLLFVGTQSKKTKSWITKKEYCKNLFKMIFVKSMKIKFLLLRAGLAEVLVIIL